MRKSSLSSPMNKKHLLLAGGAVLVAVVAITATQSNLQGALTNGGMMGMSRGTSPTGTPPTIGMGVSSAGRLGSSNASVTTGNASSMTDVFVLDPSPCIIDPFAMTFEDDSFALVEKARAQPRNPRDYDLPCKTRTFENRCGLTTNPQGDKICAGTCTDPKYTCGGDPAKGVCKCQAEPPAWACMPGGGACTGQCFGADGTTVIRGQSCVARLVGTVLTCGCEANEVVPCQYLNGACPAGAACLEAGKTCQVRGSACGCF